VVYGQFLRGPTFSDSVSQCFFDNAIIEPKSACPYRTKDFNRRWNQAFLPGKQHDSQCAFDWKRKTAGTFSGCGVIKNSDPARFSKGDGEHSSFSRTEIPVEQFRSSRRRSDDFEMPGLQNSASRIIIRPGVNFCGNSTRYYYALSECSKQACLSNARQHDQQRRVENPPFTHLRPHASSHPRCIGKA